MVMSQIGMNETTVPAAAASLSHRHDILVSNLDTPRIEIVAEQEPIDSCRRTVPEEDNANCLSPHSSGGSSSTTMQSDESTGDRSGSEGTTDRHDPPATAEFENGRFRSIDTVTTAHEPILRLVEQEAIEVSAEIFVDDHEEDRNSTSRLGARMDPPSSGDECSEENAVGDPVIRCEGVIEQDEVAEEEEVQAAEIEIEEEDLDTRARDLMPNVAEAIQQPNLNEVLVAQSRLSVSALTTTFALEEDVKPPAIPPPNALAERNSTGSSQQDQHMIFDDRTVSAVDVACADDAAAAPQLPNFKCQSQEYQPEPPPQLPAPSPLTTVHVSGSSNTTRTDTTPDEIPVAPAVLVLDENDVTHPGQSPSQSTLSRSTDPTPEHPKLERNFWLTIIAITLFMNSILVGGIVVAGFCAAGKCAAGSSASPDIKIEVLVPTPAPSRRLAASFAPTMAMNPEMIDGSFAAPVSPVEAPIGQPTTVSFVPPPTGMMGVPPLESTAPNQSPSTIGTTVEDPKFEDDDDDDINVDGPSHPVQGTDSAQGIPIRLLVLVGVLCEAMILSVVFFIYRRWRQRHLATSAHLHKTAVRDGTSSSSDAV